MKVGGFGTHVLLEPVNIKVLLLLSESELEFLVPFLWEFWVLDVFYI